jgi:hypothetical protein
MTLLIAHRVNRNKRREGIWPCILKSVSCSLLSPNKGKMLDDFKKLPVRIRGLSGSEVAFLPPNRAGCRIEL